MSRFGPRDRLRHPREFEAVLKGGLRLHEPLLSAAVRANTLDRPRLGLAISARAVRTAVGRNLLKRQARDTFRRSLGRLPALDIVILAKPGAGKADRAALRGCLERIWLRAATCTAS